MKSLQAVVLLLAVLVSLDAAAQTNLSSRANALWESGKRAEALTLYEELAKDDPKSSEYAERLMLCLYAKSDEVKDQSEKKKLLERTQAEAKNAATLGSTLEAVQKVAGFDLSRLDTGPYKGESLGQAIWMEGGKYFGRPGDTQSIQWYAAASELEPRIVEPAEYAGDAAQFMGDFDLATQWYKKAIANNPSDPQPYLHWGDAYIRLKGDVEGAKAKYIDAAVAFPYFGKSWQGLLTWVNHENGFLAPPKIELSKSADGAAGKRSPAWSAYWRFRENYKSHSGHAPTFFSAHPAEQTYRDSLAEKEGAIRAALASMSGGDETDESLKNLRMLDGAGMLDCWILINDGDEGIAQDYPGYRKDHWELLHEYIERYIVHAGANPAKTQAG